jgi:hypothetical protein
MNRRRMEEVFQLFYLTARIPLLISLYGGLSRNIVQFLLEVRI